MLASLSFLVCQELISQAEVFLDNPLQRLISEGIVKLNYFLKKLERIVLSPVFIFYLTLTLRKKSGGKKNLIDIFTVPNLALSSRCHDTGRQILPHYC